MLNQDSESKYDKLDSFSFAKMLNIREDELSENCRNQINTLDFRYRHLTKIERDQVIHSLCMLLENDLPVSGPKRKKQWEDGWEENLQEYISSNFDENALTPKYYQKGITIMRLFGDFIMPLSPKFEINVLTVLQIWLVENFLSSVNHVYEFGCGPAHNLFSFAKMLPKVFFHGCDWAISSQELIKLLAEKNKLNIQSKNFDMFHPDIGYKLEKKSAVLTIGSMEQLGNNFLPFFNYIISQKVEYYVHIEPIKELHDDNSLIDYLAIRLMEKRGYLTGFLDHLKRLEQEDKVKITHCSPIIGSTNYIGWNLIAWQQV